MNQVEHDALEKEIAELNVSVISFLNVLQAEEVLRPVILFFVHLLIITRALHYSHLLLLSPSLFSSPLSFLLSPLFFFPPSLPLLFSLPLSSSRL